MEVNLIINIVAILAGLATIIGAFYAFFRNLKIDLGTKLDKIDKIDTDVKAQNKRMDHMFEIIRQESIAHTQRIDYSIELMRRESEALRREAEAKIIAYTQRTDQLYEMMMGMIKEGFKRKE